MSNFSILLLKDSDVGVSQYHFGKKLLFFLLMLLMLGAAALAWKFFEQHQTIANQNQLLEKQEKSQVAYQQRIDLYDGRESRITFLEDYVEELKQAEQNSNVMYKKHTPCFVQTPTNWMNYIILFVRHLKPNARQISIFRQIHNRRCCGWSR